MAFLSTSDFAQDKPSVFARILNAVGNYFVRYMNAQCRSAEVQQMNAMSDAELATHGVKRDDIVRYVFRDVCYL